MGNVSHDDAIAPVSHGRASSDEWVVRLLANDSEMLVLVGDRATVRNGRFGFEPAAPRVVSPPDKPYLVIIDDEDHIREVAALSLEMTEGWRVEAVGSGALGLSLVRTSHPDAILLDVMMPEMDGPSCLLELRAHPATREIPVIFLTAKVHAGDLRKFTELGVQGVIAKPFDPIALGGQIRKVLSW